MNKLQKHLKSIGACKEAIKWTAQFKGRNAIQQAWDACESGYWMEWLFRNTLSYPLPHEQRNILDKIWAETRTSDSKKYANIIRKHIPKVPK